MLRAWWALSDRVVVRILPSELFGEDGKVEKPDNTMVILRQHDRVRMYTGDGRHLMVYGYNFGGSGNSWRMVDVVTSTEGRM